MTNVDNIVNNFKKTDGATDIDYDELWKKALVLIEMEVSGANFKTWFKDSFILKIENSVLELGIPNKIVKDWLSRKYHTFLLKTLSNIGLQIKNIEYVVSKKHKVDEQINNGGDLENWADQNENSKNTLPILNKKMMVNKNDGLNPKYTLNSFIVGKFNQLAHAAAEAVINNPGLAYNPLFIYGATGYGKTHLIQALGNKLKEKYENYTVFYVTAEKFTVDYVNAIKTGKANSFKDKYRRYDLLIMDDIQFIAEKEQTQEELFHLFNAMYDQNKQIVFSSDKHPNQIPGFAERLKSRFAAGMIAEISNPDFESRIEIIKSKLELKKLNFSNKKIEFIAKNTSGNIRELEGVVNHIVIYSNIEQDEISEEKILEIIEQITPKSDCVDPELVLTRVSEYYKIDGEDLKKKTRKKDIVHPRQVLMFILREDLDVSFLNIGNLLGGRDHSTVIHSYEKIKKELNTSSTLKKEIEEIRNILKSKY